MTRSERAEKREDEKDRKKKKPKHILFQKKYKLSNFNYPKQLQSLLPAAFTSATPPPKQSLPLALIV